MVDRVCHPSYEGTNVHNVSIFILYNNNDNEIRSRRRRRRVCVLSAHNIILYKNVGDLSISGLHHRTMCAV